MLFGFNIPQAAAFFNRIFARGRRKNVPSGSKTAAETENGAETDSAAAARLQAAAAGEKTVRNAAQSRSSSACQSAALASEGMRQSPRGERDTVPTFGPSGRQLRLNCWEKNRQ